MYKMMLHDLSAGGFFVAYLDPGSGSYILQFAIAGLLGLAFVARSFWRNAVDSLVKIFRRNRRNAESDG